MAKPALTKEVRYVVSDPDGTKREFTSELRAISFIIETLVQERMNDDECLTLGDAIVDCRSDLIPYLTRADHPKNDAG